MTRNSGQALTHTPGYSIHKYWSRKPHNVVRELVSGFLPAAGGLLVDPCCGSGVSLSEAAELGAVALGADLNPAAALLSRVTCDPPDARDLREHIDTLLTEFEDRFGSRYRLAAGRELRYAVHEVQTRCACGSLRSAWSATRADRKYRCPNCGARLSFGMGHGNTTRVVQVRTVCGEILDDPEACLAQDRSAAEPVCAVDDAYDCALLPNRRILAAPGMTVADLFTARAFSAAAWLFEQAREIQDVAVRDACTAFLTSTVAQFSRLIPFRNHLTTGGPAWTVPGFWVAPVHLEGNPAVHLRARKGRFLKGIAELAARTRGGRVSVQCSDAIQFLQGLQAKGTAADVVFLDPPYGDSVPYLEFSAVWNGFLRQVPAYEQEIVVSDRTASPSGWEQYRVKLRRLVRESAAILKPAGKLLVTFNNLDSRAWFALLEATAHAGLRCEQARYQTPAVVSAKAQFSPQNSYQGDFYCVFGRRANWPEETLDPESVLGLAEGGGNHPPALVKRQMILAILENNLNPEILWRLDGGKRTCR